MMTQNVDVTSGQANGSTAALKRVLMKRGRRGFRYVKVSMEGEVIYVPCVSADAVEAIELEHENKKMCPLVFKLAPCGFTFKANIPFPDFMGLQSCARDTVTLHAVQLPVVSNTATTGHKLQGATLECLCVHDWNYRDRLRVT